MLTACFSVMIQLLLLLIRIAIRLRLSIPLVCRFPGVSDRQTHRCLAGKLPRLAGPAVHRTKMCLSAKSTRYFTVFVVVV